MSRTTSIAITRGVHAMRTGPQRFLQMAETAVASIVTIMPIMIAALTGCEWPGSPDPPDGGQTPIAYPSYRRDIQPIFDRSCMSTGCHNPPSTAASLVLSTYADLMAGSQGGTYRVVISGDAENSEIVRRLEGRSTRIGGLRMPPPDAAPLPRSEIQTIRNWINELAQNN